MEQIEERIADMIASYSYLHRKEPKYILISGDLLPRLMNCSSTTFSIRALKDGPEYKFMGVEVAKFLTGENRLEIV